jgi:hypothetical protein
LNATDTAFVHLQASNRSPDVMASLLSGHAMFAGSNYLVPVDAALHDQADVRRLTRVDDFRHRLPKQLPEIGLIDEPILASRVGQMQPVRELFVRGAAECPDGGVGIR